MNLEYLYIFAEKKELRYAQSIYHERYVEFNSSHLYSTGRCIGGDDLHSAETPFSIRPVILIQVCSST